MKRLFRMTYGERIGLILILLLTGIVLYLNKAASGAVHSEESFFCIDSSFQKEVEVYLASLENERYERKSRTPKNAPVYDLFPFDPNKADSATLNQLGLPRFVCQNILKYRRKGGLFRNKAAFGKIYGMDSLKYAELVPYIRIDSLDFVKPVVRKDSVNFSSFKFKEKVIVDLNQADTSVLMKIPGIGSGYSKMIVSYRNQLGGFYSVRQLHEITRIPDSVRRNVEEWFEISASFQIRKIPVNKSSVERLCSHPYLNFYQAKAIQEIKKKRGAIRHINELSLLDEFSALHLELLSYYLDFES